MSTPPTHEALHDLRRIRDALAKDGHVSASLAVNTAIRVLKKTIEEKTGAAAPARKKEPVR